MGFSLYWKWEKPLADAEKFAAWSRDVQHLLASLTAPGYHASIPAIFSFDRCYTVEVRQDGSPHLTERDPPPRKANWLIICGPEGTGEPIFTPTQVAFNGEASRGEECEGFTLSLEELAKAPFWQACKTGASPYATLAILAQARFIEYFPEATMYNDEGQEPIAKAVAFSQHVFGENRSPRPWD